MESLKFQPTTHIQANEITVFNFYGSQDSRQVKIGWNDWEGRNNYLVFQLTNAPSFSANIWHGLGLNAQTSQI